LVGRFFGDKFDSWVGGESFAIVRSFVSINSGSKGEGK
jgi:hypothetical protein